MADTVFSGPHDFGDAAAAQQAFNQQDARAAFDAAMGVAAANDASVDRIRPTVAGADKFAIVRGWPYR